MAKMRLIVTGPRGIDGFGKVGGRAELAIPGIRTRLIGSEPLALPLRYPAAKYLELPK